MRSVIKKVRAAVDKGDSAEANELLPVAIAQVATVASRGAIHRNTAARTISRLNRAVNKVQ